MTVSGICDTKRHELVSGLCDGSGHKQGTGNFGGKVSKSNMAGKHVQACSGVRTCQVWVRSPALYPLPHGCCVIRKGWGIGYDVEYDWCESGGASVGFRFLADASASCC